MLTWEMGGKPDTDPQPWRFVPQVREYSLFFWICSFLAPTLRNKDSRACLHRESLLCSLWNPLSLKWRVKAPRQRTILPNKERLEMISSIDSHGSFVFLIHSFSDCEFCPDKLHVCKQHWSYWWPHALFKPAQDLLISIKLAMEHEDWSNQVCCLHNTCVRSYKKI